MEGVGRREIPVGETVGLDEGGFDGKDVDGVEEGLQDGELDGQDVGDVGYRVG